MPDEFHYCPFMISVNMCNGSCNTVDDRFSRKGVPIKIKDVNLKVFNIIKGINQSWTYAKHISCECRYNDGEI